MVTEYNRNVIMRRRAEAAMAAEELKNSGAVKTTETKPAEAVEVKKTETVRPKKSDAEKLRKGKK